jgi:acyl carrier protein
MDVEKELIEIIAKRLKIDPSLITLDSRFVEDLGADSLAVMDIVIKIEEKFGLDEIPDEELEKMKRVRDAVEYIKKHI